MMRRSTIWVFVSGFFTGIGVAAVVGIVAALVFL